MVRKFGPGYNSNINFLSPKNNTLNLNRASGNTKITHRFTEQLFKALGSHSSSFPDSIKRRDRQKKKHADITPGIKIHDRNSLNVHLKLDPMRSKCERETLTALIAEYSKILGHL